MEGAANTASALTVLDGLNFSDVTSTLALVITGTTAGAGGTAGQFSQVFVTAGMVSLGGNLALILNGYAPTSPGDTFDIIVNPAGSPASGTFANAGLDHTAGDTPEVTVGNIQFDINYAGGRAAVT